MMKTIDHLTPAKIKKVAEQLWHVSSSLNSLGGLFLYQNSESCLDANEFAGIGHLLQEFSKELGCLEDILRCGYDSVTKSELERDYEETSPYGDKNE